MNNPWCIQASMPLYNEFMKILFPLIGNISHSINAPGMKYILFIIIVVGKRIKYMERSFILINHLLVKDQRSRLFCNVHQGPFLWLFKNLPAMVSTTVASSFYEFLYSIIYGSVKICLTALNFKIEWFFTFYFHYIRMSWLWLVSRVICKPPPNLDLYDH